MKNLRSKLVHLGVFIWLCMTCRLGYDNVRLVERVMELDVANDINMSIAINYMKQYAKCVKYVEIMHETCNCESTRK